MVQARPGRSPVEARCEMICELREEKSQRNVALWLISDMWLQSCTEILTLTLGMLILMEV